MFILAKYRLQLIICSYAMNEFQHTDHNEISTRLIMWQSFLETGVQCCPEDIEDGNFDISWLLHLAHESDNAGLRALARATEAHMHKYDARIDALEQAMNNASIDEITYAFEQRRAKTQAQQKPAATKVKHTKAQTRH
jgi:acyl transferase domain-containing protein